MSSTSWLDSRTVNSRAFMDGLQRAREAVVQIAISDGSGETRCTGWLITPRLVVLPAHAMREQTRSDIPVLGMSWRVSGRGWQDDADGETTVERLTIERSDGRADITDLAVLRLRNEHPSPRLSYRQDTPQSGELVMLPHHGVLPETGGLVDAAGEAHLSFVQLQEVAEETLSYQGSLYHGSSGAILYDLHWRFLGLHHLSRMEVYSGPAQAEVMTMLRRSRWWSEVARHQGLADVVAVRQAILSPMPAPTPTPQTEVSSPLLLRAALSFSIDPEKLKPEERDELAPQVVDARSPRWTLAPAVRRKVLASVAFDTLIGYVPPKPDTPEQRVIVPIVRGDVQALEQADDEDLARWLQAVRWFAGLVPNLPTAAKIYALLQYRQVRGRLSRIASRDFVGRVDELAQMQSWFDAHSMAPLNIWGIGGIGKSALVAHFLVSLPADTLLLWLDFDRADLAPDDAFSIIAALHEQVLAQLTGTTDEGRPAMPDPLDEARVSLVRILTAAKQRRVIIVLDSFEAAQYAERYQELWPELERLAQHVDGLQVIVSGRASLPMLRFCDVVVQEIRLEGLAPSDAQAWLGRHGIPPGPIQDEVVRVAGGSPLVLRLAERLVEAGGGLDHLPQHLPEKMIAGVLYDRILDRVHNPAFKEVAKGAIVLRRLSADMVPAIFGGLLTVPDGSPATWFREFAREAALVEGGEELRLRPEVRAAALALLERHEPDLVEKIERRALAWYDALDLNDPAVAAERVYYFLRRGDEAGASSAWREGCAQFLQYAEETLRDAEKDWLTSRLGTSASIFDAGVEVWESDAATRVTQSRSAGLKGSPIGIFHERIDRSVGGALAFHEAYESWNSGDRESALTYLLQHGIENDDPRSRERAMLAALIYAERGQGTMAERILRTWSDADRWRDRRNRAAERAAIHAARICLLAPLEAEKIVFLTGKFSDGRFDGGVLAMDLLREDTRLKASAAFPSLSAFVLQLSGGKPSRFKFLDALEKYRQSVIGYTESERLRSIRARIWHDEFSPVPVFSENDLESRILVSSWQRWALLAEGAISSVLADVFMAGSTNALNQSIVTVLSLFAGIPGLRLMTGQLPLEEILDMVQRRFGSRFDERPRSSPRPPMIYDPNVPTAVSALRHQALQWCGATPEPLYQLVQRFAGRLDEE